MYFCHGLFSQFEDLITNCIFSLVKLHEYFASNKCKLYTRALCISSSDCMFSLSLNSHNLWNIFSINKGSIIFSIKH